jgi:ubiquinol-cytochrome c reductase cytochrome b subunit
MRIIHWLLRFIIVLIAIVAIGLVALDWVDSKTIRSKSVHTNFIPANPMKMPEHIKPQWYFSPLFTMSRAQKNKLSGVIVMFLAIVMLGLVPLIITVFLLAPAFSRAQHTWFDKPFLLFASLGILLATVIALGYLGYFMEPAHNLTWAYKLLTISYFLCSMVIPLTINAKFKNDTQ